MHVCRWPVDRRGLGLPQRKGSRVAAKAPVDEQPARAAVAPAVEDLGLDCADVVALLQDEARRRVCQTARQGHANGDRLAVPRVGTAARVGTAGGGRAAGGVRSAGATDAANCAHSAQQDQQSQAAEPEVGSCPGKRVLQRLNRWEREAWAHCEGPFWGWTSVMRKLGQIDHGGCAG